MHKKGKMIARMNLNRFVINLFCFKVHPVNENTPQEL